MIENLIEMLGNASAEDLAALDAQIDTQEKAIDGLRALRKVIDVRINGKPARQPAAPRKTTAAEGDAEPGRREAAEQRRIKAAKYLIHSGPAKPSKINDELELDMANPTSFFTHPYFQRTGPANSLVEVAPAGRQAVKEAS